MPKKNHFIYKLIKHLDRVDRSSLQDYMNDLLQKNALYEAIFREVPDGIVVVSPSGQIHFINQTAAEWLGISPKDAHRVNIIESVGDSALSRFLSQHLDGLTQNVVQDFTLLSPREIAIRIQLISLRDTDKGEILILLQNNRSGFSQAWDERTARIESLIQLAAGIAHEIGNPLNSIGIHLQLLKKEIKSLPSEKKKPFVRTVQVIQSETERLDKIVRDFLKATRKSPLRFQHDNINMIIQDALDFMRPELKSNGIDLQLRIDQDVDAFLLDRERLYQAFLNIIKNAMEAMPGGGSLQVHTKQKGNVVSIRFSDKGQGIPEKDLPRIFDAYFTTKAQGSGLGLITVYDAVRDHGGRIEVASKSGKGTTFTLFFPVRKPKLQIPQMNIVTSSA